MTKNNLFKIIFSLFFLLSFFIVTLTLIIIPTQKKIDVDFRTAGLTQSNFGGDITYYITNNSNEKVIIDKISFTCYEFYNQPTSAEKQLTGTSVKTDVILEAGETISCSIHFYTNNFDELSNFEAHFENMRFAGNSILLYVGIGFTLPTLLSGYLFAINLYEGIKARKKLMINF